MAIDGGLYARTLAENVGGGGGVYAGHYGKSFKAQHMMQLFSSHCYAPLDLFQDMKLKIRNL